MSPRCTFHRRSSASKLGGIPATYTESSTCPPACPFAGDRGACFARSGLHTRTHWEKVDSGERGISWREMCRKVASLPPGTLWRHDVAGDLPGKGNRIAPSLLRDLAHANQGRRGFTYTHKPPTPANLRAIREASSLGFVVNLSANSLSHADRLARHGLPLTVVLPKDHAGRTAYTPEGRKVVACPAVTVPGMNCARCGLCQRDHETRPIVGFPAHGPRANEASRIASE